MKSIIFGYKYEIITRRRYKDKNIPEQAKSQTCYGNSVIVFESDLRQMSFRISDSSFRPSSIILSAAPAAYIELLASYPPSS